MSTDLLQSGLPPPSDRMLTTCFLAALFHGILILGVTFSAPNLAAGGKDPQALEVVLVNDQAPVAAKNPNASYLAERTQIGTGNMLAAKRTLIPGSSPPAGGSGGEVGGTGLTTQQAATDFGDEELLATHDRRVLVAYFAAPPAPREAAQMPTPAESRPDLGMMPNDDGIELRMRGETRNQLWVTADTQESDVAVYLDAWRRKIERVGTLNFPDVARRRNLSGTPVIEVTIGADGRLLATTLRRSSGHAEIDEAALRILKLASPYDPFPRALNAKHDEIRIAYEWEFIGGGAQGGNVYYADPKAPGASP